MSARSFTLTAALPEDLARPLAEVRGHVTSPSGGLVFVSGGLAQQSARVADQVRAAWKGVPVCVVPAAGVITERGELEGASAIAGVLWSGGRSAPFKLRSTAITDDDDPSEGADSEATALAGAIDAAIVAAGRPRGATALIFARPEAFRPELLDGLRAAASKLCVLGAGTVGGPALTIDSGGSIEPGPVAGLLISGLAPPLVESTAACRLLSSFQPIEEASGGLVLRVGGRSALDLLSSLTSDVGGGAAGSGAAATPGRGAPIVFAAIADDEPGPEGKDRYVVRPVRGVDPARGAVMIGREARVGARFAFGVRCAATARAGLEAAARSIATSALGAAPRFALYLSCAGRGHSLYGSPDVEARVLRQRFGDLPIAGMHSAFELAPWGAGAARLSLYTGVLALFRSPS